MLKTLKNLLGLVASEDASTEELAPSLPAAATEVANARDALEQAGLAYQSSLLSADEPALRRLIDARRDAEMRLDRALALQSALRDRLAAAKEAERVAEVTRLHAVADAAADAYREAVTNDLPAVINAVRGMLRLAAEAEIAREAAMKADPTRPARPQIDAFRATPDRKERRISVGPEVEHWCHDDGERLAEANQDRVTVASDGSGFLRHGTGSTRFTRKRLFRRVEVLSREYGERAEPLAKVLAIPGVTACDQPGWRPLENPSPARILAALDQLDRQLDPSVDTRQPRVVFEPMGDIIVIAPPRTLLDRLAGRVEAV